tara:strand:+ start:291 stop:749 length:459 start_codon:yes stop_codon:yes gene_type:complete
MNLKRIIIIFSLIFISSCGYEVVNNFEKNKYQIKDYNLIGDKYINNLLSNNLNRFSNNNKATRYFDLEITSKKERQISSKNTSGDAETYKIKVIINFKIFENNELIDNKSFSKNINYNKLVSNFETNQYENILIKDLTNQILFDFNNYLQRL